MKNYSQTEFYRVYKVCYNSTTLKITTFAYGVWCERMYLSLRHSPAAGCVFAVVMCQNVASLPNSTLTGPDDALTQKCC